jgi:hypothetical protein
VSFQFTAMYPWLKIYIKYVNYNNRLEQDPIEIADKVLRKFFQKGIEGRIMLDMTAGTCTYGVAALHAGAGCINMEIDPVSFTCTLFVFSSWLDSSIYIYRLCGNMRGHGSRKPSRPAELRRRQGNQWPPLQVLPVGPLLEID